MADPHALAVRRAEQTARLLLQIFNRLGNTAHPRGRMLVVYRAAIRALRGNLSDPAAVSDALRVLRLQLATIATDEIATAAELGATAATHNLEVYGISARAATLATHSITTASTAAVMALVDRQIAAVSTGIALGAVEAEILGDAARVGVLSPLATIAEAERYAAATTSATFDQVVQASAGGQRFERQAVAAIDERTTNCCLEVHGQTQPMGEPFHLTGVPRFADYVLNPPFHGHCRTATSLVPAGAPEDGVTREMKDAAQAELQARAEAQSHQREIERQLADLGAAPDIRARKADSEQVTKLRTELRYWRERERQEIHPAHARSGRG